MKGSHICKSCESIMIPKKLYKGSFLLELLIWIIALVFAPFTIGVSVVLAIIYSIWRISNKPKVCKKCESKDIIPIDSPAAKSILEKHNLVEV